MLPKEIYDYIAYGSGNKITLLGNLQAYFEVALIPRVLKKIFNINAEVKIINEKFKKPIFIAPTSFHTLLNSEGEIATAKAAENSSSQMIVSMMSGVTLEKIAASTSSPLWFQLHIHKDFNITKDLIRRAEIANYKAIVITVDTPVIEKKRRALFSQLNFLRHCIAANFIEYLNPASPWLPCSATEFNPECDWDDIKKIKTFTKLPIILKGIMHHSDVTKALKYHIDGIIVSNHGGRQLDGAASSLEVLPKIKKAAKDKMSILIDGGIRSGSDIVKAIALGADGVLVGRPILWGLATLGQQGVETVINDLYEDMLFSMRLIGCSSIKEIKKEGSSLIHFRAHDRIS